MARWTPRLVAASRVLIDEALAAERYDVALEAATLAFRAGQSVAGRDFRKETLDRRREIEELHAARQKLEEMLARVEANPADGEAHLFLGRWYCFEQNDWMVGLDHLAKGSDAELAAVARRENDEAPTEPADQVALADAWWDLAQNREDEQEKTVAMRHAGAWYRQAQPSFPGGLEKVKIDRRLAEIAALGGAAPELPGTSPSVIRPGLGAYKSGVEFHRARFRLRGGKATAVPPSQPPPGQVVTPHLPGPATLPPVPATADVPQGQWVDLLKPVDIAADRVTGKWTRDGQGVAIAPEKFCRLMLPVRVDASYELAFEFTRHSGISTVGALLPVGSTDCHLMLSRFDGKTSGIDQIDGQPGYDNASTKKPGSLENGHRYQVLVRVQQSGPDVEVKVLLDGKPYISWAGKQASLKATNDWHAPDKSRPTLTAWITPVTFHTVRLRLLSGKATWVRPTGAPSNR